MLKHLEEPQPIPFMTVMHCPRISRRPKVHVLEKAEGVVNPPALGGESRLECVHEKLRNQDAIWTATKGTN
jgi:hypothetical protein